MLKLMEPHLSVMYGSFLQRLSCLWLNCSRRRVRDQSPTWSNKRLSLWSAGVTPRPYVLHYCSSLLIIVDGDSSRTRKLPTPPHCRGDQLLSPLLSPTPLYICRTREEDPPGALHPHPPQKQTSRAGRREKNVEILSKNEEKTMLFCFAATCPAYCKTL